MAAAPSLEHRVEALEAALALPTPGSVESTAAAAAAVAATGATAGAGEAEAALVKAQYRIGHLTAGYEAKVAEVAALRAQLVAAGITPVEPPRVPIVPSEAATLGAGHGRRTA